MSQVAPISSRPTATIKSRSVEAELLSIKDVGVSVTIPDHPVGKLMFYLKCCLLVLNMDFSDETIHHFTDYKNYFLLTWDEVKSLYAVCSKLNPEFMTRVKLFIKSNNSSDTNDFYEIANVELAASETKVELPEDVTSILHVQANLKIMRKMIYTESFADNKYYIPMRKLSMHK